ncbi:MAG: hypothetical protein ABID04_02915 [Patescibacteria group bacterium]
MSRFTEFSRQFGLGLRGVAGNMWGVSGIMLDLQVRSFVEDRRLIDKPMVRRATSLVISRGTEIEDPPLVLFGPSIGLTNYPGVGSVFDAMSLIVERLSGKGPLRVKILSRFLRMNPIKAGFVGEAMLPLGKDPVTGRYTLTREDHRVIKEHLALGGVLIATATGRAGRENQYGLGVADVRTGLWRVAQQHGDIPVVPIGLVTSEDNMEGPIRQIRFGQPIFPFSVEQVGRGERNKEYLRWQAMVGLASIAQLLPIEQRGDCEFPRTMINDYQARINDLVYGQRTRAY